MQPYALLRRALLMGLASIVMTLIFTMPSFGTGQVALSDGTEDATVQIACADADALAANPLPFTVNYQNRKRDVSYNRNTTACPIRDFAGELLRGESNSGNVQSVTIGGQVVQRNGGEREVAVPLANGLIIIVIIDVYDYSGRLYIEITVISIG